MDKLLDKGKRILFGPQTSILSAATVIMIMMLVSRVLGYARQRILLHYFVPDESALFFAAFRLPDLIFEVLVFGTFASAFIPVFARLIKRGNGEAWDTAGRVVNLGVLFFTPFAIVVGVFAHSFYSLIAPGFNSAQIDQIASIARLLFLAQLFFVVSYVLTGVLESLHRFLVPALAPLFYNLGIILGIVLLGPTFGLMGPAIGVVIGALAHLLVQLPFAIKMGFRFSTGITPTPEVRKIGRLALPRLVDLSFQQVSKIVELNFSSLISPASYTYLTVANTLNLLPVSLFGTTVAKAALPTLSQQDDDPEGFKNTLLSTLYQVMFITFPVAVIFMVLRIPIVRLAFGTDLFDWESTVQTSLALSAYAIGIPFQAALSILNRAYYALHDTKTPVAISILGVLTTITSSFIFIKKLGLPVWGMAAAFSAGVILQCILLFLILNRRLKNISFWSAVLPIVKSIVAATLSGFVMYFLLKFFDRSVWVKRLSFLGTANVDLPFDKFVLDTRYTFNLVILTIGVAAIGGLVYILTSWLLGSKELIIFTRFLKRFKLSSPAQDQEMITPPPNEPAS